MDNETPKLLSMNEATSCLGGISRRYLERLIEAGTLPSVKLGRRRFIDGRDVARLVEELRKRCR
jgi:excisionase family DNA binding protein